MYTTIRDKTVRVYEDNGQIKRMFQMRASVTQATVGGDTVAILTDDGYTSLYNLNGQIIRRAKAR